MAVAGIAVQAELAALGVCAVHLFVISPGAFETSPTCWFVSWSPVQKAEFQSDW